MNVEDTVSLITAILGGFILLYGLCSLVIKEKLYISEAFVAVIFGILIGPRGVNLVNMNALPYKQDMTQQLARTVIAIQVMAAGVALPKAYLKTEFQSLCVLLIPVIVWMWLISGLCLWFVIPGLTFLEALMIASCFTPTDPVLASSIVNGHFAERHVPVNVRDIISAESAANDGLGFPFLFLATYLIQMPVEAALTKWAFSTLLYEIGLSVVIGFLAGTIARKAVQLAQRRDWMDNESFIAYAIALTLFVMGTVGLLGSDDLLACFIAGNAFTWDDWFRIETKESPLSSVVDMLLNIFVFVYIGIATPWDSFTGPTLSYTRLACLAILVILFRRLPAVMALYQWIPAIRNWREAAFTGWFGPIGVGAVFYCTVALANFSPDGPNAYARSLLEPVVYFMILSSVFVHGITVPLLHISKLAKRSYPGGAYPGTYLVQDDDQKSVSTYGSVSVGI